MYLQEFAKKIGKKPQIHSMLDSIKDKDSYRNLTLKRKQIIKKYYGISWNPIDLLNHNYFY